MLDKIGFAISRLAAKWLENHGYFVYHRTFQGVIVGGMCDVEGSRYYPTIRNPYGIVQYLNGDTVQNLKEPFQRG
jgi:hypothetical protein